MKLSRKERNLITILLAIIAVIVVVLLFLSFNKKATQKPHTKRFLDIDELEAARQARIRELHSIRDGIQLERYKLKETLLRLRAIELWAELQVEKVFKWIRWILFGGVSLLFTLAWLAPKWSGFGVDDVLKVISVVAILIVLLFFATCEENDSLLRCYHRAKPATVRLFMRFTMKFLTWKSPTKPKEKAVIVIELKTKYDLLVPIMVELRTLDQR